MAFDAKLEMTGNTAEISLSGELDATAASTFKQEIDKAAAEQAKRLVLLLQDLEYIASAGIRVLVMAKQKMGADVDIYAIAPQEQVMETIEMTGLHHSIHILDEYDDTKIGETWEREKSNSSALLRLPYPVDTLTVSATLDALSAITDYVMVAAKAAGLDNKATYRLRLAVDEIATNVILHGHANAGHKGVMSVSHKIEGGFLKIFLEDTGTAYDPRQTPAPDNLDLPLEQRDVGGLGVYLTMRSVDEFHYEHTGKRNRNIFFMSLNKP